jgi:Fe-S-cluster containining protein
VLLLRLSNDTVKRCPFVTSDGCTVYPYRPWSCRVYPLQPEGNAIANSSGKEYYSATKTTFCLGFLENQVSTVKQWTEHQGIPIYREMETYFQKITLNKSLSGKKIQNKKIREMIYMACYDLDRFRRFVFESTFLKRFEMDPAEVKQLKSDDVALYKFAMRWLEYGLIKQATLNVKPDILSTEQPMPDVPRCKRHHPDKRSPGGLLQRIL